MPAKPLDSESDDLEVKFDSCVNLTMTVHKNLLAQLLDPHNQVTPSVHANPKFGETNADYTDITLTIANPSKINWDYVNPDPGVDHGFAIVEVVSQGQNAMNPLSRLRQQLNTLFEDKLRGSLR